MRPLRPGQDTVLSWDDGAVDCRVVAAAGSYVLLQLGRLSLDAEGPPSGRCSLTYLEGITPMGQDGTVEFSPTPGEMRFKVDGMGAPDRRGSVRLPISAPVDLVADGTLLPGRLLDVSAGGLRLRHTDQLRGGDTVRVRFQLPSGGPWIDADATVRAAEFGLSALQFTTMHAGSPQEIGAWTVSMLRASLAGGG